MWVQSTGYMRNVHILTNNCLTGEWCACDIPVTCMVLEMLSQWKLMIISGKKEMRRLSFSIFSCTIQEFFYQLFLFERKIFIWKKNNFLLQCFSWQRLSRLEEEEKNRVETRKRKFFAEILNAAREFQLQAQAALKRRKQRNDGVQVGFHSFF